MGEEPDRREGPTGQSERGVGEAGTVARVCDFSIDPALQRAPRRVVGRVSVPRGNLEKVTIRDRKVRTGDLGP